MARDLSAVSRSKLSAWGQSFRELLKNRPLHIDNPVYNNRLDFGTSSTKIIVRFPYESEQPAFALPVPEELRANNHPNCWKTLLWIKPDTGQLSLSYKNGFEPITEIKTLAMQKVATGGQSMASSAGMIPEFTAIAYVGLLLRVIKGWINLDVFPVLGINPNERKVSWELNMGLPASKKDDKKISDKFQRIIEYAWKLSNQSDSLLASEIQPLIMKYRDQKIDADISIRPEVIARTVGLCGWNIRF